MTHRVYLRPATADDAEAIADVYLRSRHELVSHAPLMHPDDDVRRRVRDVLIPAGHVTVALVDGVVVGMIGIAEREGAAWIDQLYVAPDRVGAGVGSRLLEHALSVLPRPIRLYTFERSTRARSFYERHGFRAIAFDDGSGNEEGEPDVLYELA